MKYTTPIGCQIPNLAAIYEKYVAPSDNPTFVEIGAYDGRSYSNTCDLADSGWTGFYVEPYVEFAAQCARNHVKNPKVRVFQTAIGDHAGEVDFFIIGECSTIVWNQTAKDWGGNPNNKTTVDIVTLDTQLERMDLTPGWELLVIDVEGAELSVLRGFSVRRWKPKMVIIETHELDGNVERNSKAVPITAYFSSAGYAKVHTDHINSIFVLP